MVEAKEWIGLLHETREALANLRADELETLAVRAQQALDANLGVLPQDHRELAARHRVLGDVIAATGENLNVLRRLRGVDGSQRWVR